MATRPAPLKPQLSLALTPARPDYPASAVPDFRAAIKNTGKTAVKLCTYMLRYRLLAAMNATDSSGQEYALFPFVAAKYSPIKPADLKLIAPGQEITEELMISSSADWGFVKNGSLPPVVKRGYITKSFAPGAATFSTMIFGKMAIYAGENDVYDGTWQQKALPEELAGAEKLDLTGVFRGEIEAKVKISFR